MWHCHIWVLYKNILTFITLYPFITSHSVWGFGGFWCLSINWHLPQTAWLIFPFHLVQCRTINQSTNHSIFRAFRTHAIDIHGGAQKITLSCLGWKFRVCRIEDLFIFYFPHQFNLSSVIRQSMTVAQRYTFLLWFVQNCRSNDHKKSLGGKESCR